MAALYDTIGIDYANLRRPDPRIAAIVHAELGDAETVLNVGAGAGSYEPTHIRVTALEPSAEMIAQRPASAATAVQASAETLPFDDDAFDASMAILTIHHWEDQRRGLEEMRRVSRGPVVILTFDPVNDSFWLLDYLPQLLELDKGQMPCWAFFEEALGPIRRVNVPIPHDCTDGFLCAYWRRPAAYLDPKLRAAMSSFWKIGDPTGALNRLEVDLRSGAWERKYGHYLDLEACDFGYHLIVAD